MSDSSKPGWRKHHSHREVWEQSLTTLKVLSAPETGTVRNGQEGTAWKTGDSPASHLKDGFQHPSRGG